MSLLFHRRLARIAAIGALAAALGLAGCGRKAGLDPPPNAAVTDQNVAANGAPPAASPQSGNGVGPDGRAAAPAAGPKRWTPLDWLIE